MVVKTAHAQWHMTYLRIMEQAQALVTGRRNRLSSVLHVVASDIDSNPTREAMVALARDESQVSFDSRKIQLSRTGNACNAQGQGAYGSEQEEGEGH